MAYTAMKNLINNAINKFKNGTITSEEYGVFKTNTMNKLDIFLTCDRLTSEQYEELVRMMQIEEVTSNEN